MKKLNDINEALYELKAGQVLTVAGSDLFVYKQDSIYHYFSGSSVVLKLDDFISLYKETVFYIYEDNNIFIDDEKDNDYYRYYKK